MLCFLGEGESLQKSAFGLGLSPQGRPLKLRGGTLKTKGHVVSFLGCTPTSVKGSTATQCSKKGSEKRCWEGFSEGFREGGLLWVLR